MQIQPGIVRAFRWLDSDNVSDDPRLSASGPVRTEYDRWIPFLFLHLGCFGVIFTGTSLFAVTTCLVLYCIRMFAITGFYHRYFSHRSFKASRIAQAFFAILGLTAMQRGPLWWAAHHRAHHKEADRDNDPHSPVVRGFLWSHLGWLTATKNMPTDYSKVPDFSKYPELRFLNRFDWLIPLLLFIGLYGLGQYLQGAMPQFQNNGLQLIVWGFFISTTILFHATCSINSFAHMSGYRRFDIPDDSRNNPILALVTFGEGWHNNHHRYSNSVRQGFVWWELDITYLILLCMSKIGLIYDLQPVPDAVMRKVALKERES